MIEFDIAKFPKNVSSNNDISREFLEIDNNSTSSKK